jgi:MYXO-CTERM domain-containing protein
LRDQLASLVPSWAITIPLAVTGAGFSVAAPEVTIAGRATVAITVTFQPTAAGSFTGALTLGVAGDPDHAIVALAGTGLPAAPPPVDDPPVDDPPIDDPPVDDPPVDDPPDDPAGGGCSVAGRGGPGTALVALIALMTRRRRRAERASAKS